MGSLDERRFRAGDEDDEAGDEDDEADYDYDYDWDENDEEEEDDENDSHGEPSRPHEGDETSARIQ